MWSNHFLSKVKESLMSGAYKRRQTGFDDFVCLPDEHKSWHDLFSRLWVLLDHNYRIFVYKEGVLRTASETYEADNVDNLTSHITNHSLQEANSPNYGKYEPGNEIFFSEFDR